MFYFIQNGKIISKFEKAQRYPVGNDEQGNPIIYAKFLHEHLTIQSWFELDDSLEVGMEWTKNGFRYPKQEKPEKTPQEQIAIKVQNILDEKAKEKKYDSALSVRSYAGFENPFQIEAIKFSKWSAECWSYLADKQKEYEEKLESEPEILIEINVDNVLAGLPKFSWDQQVPEPTEK